MTQNTFLIRYGCNKASRAFGALLVASLALTGCDNEVVTAEDYLSRAEDYRAKGDPQASIVEAKNALREDPNNQEARLILGLGYSDLGNWSNAEKMLARAYDDKGSLEFSIRPVLARAKVSLGKYDEALQVAGIANAMNDVLKAEVFLVRGQALSGLKRYDEAVDSYKAAQKLNPQSHGPHLGFAVTALARNETDKARLHYAAAVKLAPKAVEVLLFGGHFELREGNKDESWRAFQKLIEIRPYRPDYFVARARVEIAMGKYDQAIKSLATPLKIAPSHPLTNYFVALAAYRKQDYQTAYNHAEIVLGVKPTDVSAQLLAGASGYALGQYEIALDKLKKVVSRAPHLESARQLFGELQMKTGDRRGAYATLSSLAKNNNASGSLLQMVGEARLLLKKPEEGTEYLERAVAKDPDNVRARALLGVAAIDRGDLDKGIDDLKIAVGQNPKVPQHEIALVVSLLKAKRFNDALLATAKFREKWPKSAVGAVLLGGAYRGLRKPANAQAAFEKAFELEPGRADAGHNLAMMALRDQQTDKAVEYLRTILRHHPSHARTLVTLWRIELKRKKQSDMEPLLESAIKDNQNAVLPRLLYGKLLVSTKRLSKALSIILPALRDDPKNIELLDLAARAHLARREFSAAADYLRGFTEQQPNSAQAHYFLAVSFGGMRQVDEEIQYLQKTLELDNKHNLARVALVNALIRKRRFDDADKHLANLREQFPKSPTVTSLTGDLMAARGKPKEAILIYEAMPGFRTPQVTNKIAQLRWSLNERAAAIAMLEEWVAKHPTDDINRVYLGTFLTQTGRSQEAKQVFKRLVKDNPDSWVANNEIAWALYKNGAASQALSYARRARQLAPQAASVADTMGLIQLELGNVSEALVLLREAADNMPNSLETRFHLVQALVKNGQKVEAKKLLIGILDAKVQFDSKKDASALFEKLEAGGG